MAAPATSVRALAPVVVTMGEPSGIGGETIIGCWHHRSSQAIPPFLVLDDPDRLSRVATSMGLDTPIVTTVAGDDIPSLFDTALPVLPLNRPVDAEPGAPDPRNVPAVIEAIERGVELTLSGHASAVVTSPIHKSTMYDGGFTFPGHTEFVAHLTGGALPVMMLCSDNLRVVPVTIHCSLRDAIERLSTDLIVSTSRIVADALISDFALESPRLAVAGLNPHAGEGGALGREEITIVDPAVRILQTAGISVIGPLPPDTMFHSEARARYDAAICMYHDQALIPLKALAFDRGVNATLGLPIVRTSPDHGTALDIAGKNLASNTSLAAALKLARTMAANRAARSAPGSPARDA
jgi:4-hydroxythreonine-4-phosphate dehydrogenase